MRPPAAHTLVVVLHLLITTFLAWRLNIEVDEAFSLHTTAAGPGYAFTQALGFELQPPLYFVALALWRIPSQTLFWARLPSVLAVGLTVVVVAAVSRRFVRAVNPVLVTAVVAFNPFTIWTAVEARVYGLAMLLSALLLWSFYDGFFSQPGRRASRWCHAVLAVVALHTQYYLGFLLLASGVALITTRRWRQTRSYVGAMAAVALVCLPLLLVVPSQVVSHTVGARGASNWPQALQILAGRPQRYLLPTDGPPLLPLRNRVLRPVVVLGSLLIVWVRRRSIVDAQVGMATIVAVLMACFGLALSLTDPELMADRHTVALFIPTILTAFAVAELTGRRLVIWVWGAVLLLFGITQTIAFYRPLEKDPDWRSIAQLIMESEQPGQPILVFTPPGALCLRHYYRGLNPVLAVPREIDFRTYDLRQFVMRSEEDTAAALARAPGLHTEVWLVNGGDESYLGVAFHPEYLEAFFSRCYTVVQRAVFGRHSVELLRRTRSTGGCADP